jgi:hypothetical protein
VVRWTPEELALSPRRLQHRTRTLADRAKIAKEVMLAGSTDFELLPDRKGIIEALLDNRPVVAGKGAPSHGLGHELLLGRLEAIMGLKIRHHSDSSSLRVFQAEHVLSVGQRLKPMSVVNHALGYISKMRQLENPSSAPLEESARRFLAALQQDPLDAATLRNCGQVSCRLDAWEEGAKVTLHGHFMNTPLHRRGEFAHAFFERACITSPEDSESHYQLGLYLFAQPWCAAEAFLEILRAIELAPGISQRWWILIRCLVLLHEAPNKIRSNLTSEAAVGLEERIRARISPTVAEEPKSATHDTS